MPLCQVWLYALLKPAYEINKLRFNFVISDKLKQHFQNWKIRFGESNERTQLAQYFSFSSMHQFTQGKVYH